MLRQNSSGKKQQQRPINVSLPCNVKREAVKLVVSRLDYS